jgi:hypothetical protein
MSDCHENKNMDFLTHRGVTIRIWRGKICFSGSVTPCCALEAVLARDGCEDDGTNRKPICTVTRIYLDGWSLT